MKPSAGWAGTMLRDTNQASTAPSMKNSPCATLTTRMTPKTSDRPSAVSASTARHQAFQRGEKRCGRGSCEHIHRHMPGLDPGILSVTVASFATKWKDCRVSPAMTTDMWSAELSERLRGVVRLRLVEAVLDRGRCTTFSLPPSTLEMFWWPKHWWILPLKVLSPCGCSLPSAKLGQRLGRLDQLGFGRRGPL